jgi:hypothetical protein
MSTITEELDLTITQKTLRIPTGTMQPVGIGAVGHPLRWDDPGMCSASATDVCASPTNDDNCPPTQTICFTTDGTVCPSNTC